MTLLGGDPETARALAARVVELVGAGAGLDDDHDHWRSASLGEAYLHLERLDDAPRSYRCARDALHAVFDDVPGAASFALRLVDMVASTPWDALGLPLLTARARLHAGPVHAALDPVAGGRLLVGSHVTRAARMRSIDLANAVFVTDQCASLLAVSNAEDLVCEYAGTLAGGEGGDPSTLYRLRSPAAA